MRTVYLNPGQPLPSVCPDCGMSPARWRRRSDFRTPHITFERWLCGQCRNLTVARFPDYDFQDARPPEFRAPGAIKPEAKSWHYKPGRQSLAAEQEYRDHHAAIADRRLSKWRRKKIQREMRKRG